MMTENDLIRDLVECCRNAQGAYKFLSDIGAESHMPGLKSTMQRGKEAIEKADDFLRQ